MSFSVCCVVPFVSRGITIQMVRVTTYCACSLHACAGAPQTPRHLRVTRVKTFGPSHSSLESLPGSGIPPEGASCCKFRDQFSILVEILWSQRLKVSHDCSVSAYQLHMLCSPRASTVTSTLPFMDIGFSSLSLYPYTRSTPMEVQNHAVK